MSSQGRGRVPRGGPWTAAATAVAALARWARREASVGEVAPSGEADAGRERLLAALDAVTRIEAVEPSLAQVVEPQTLWARGPVVRRPGIKPRVAKLIPRSELAGWEDGDHDVVEAAVAADVVVLGKFDVGEQPKFRAAYAKGRRTLAARPPSSTGLCGITRSVDAHRIVSRHAPDLVPPLLGHGDLDGLRYVVEGWVRGRALRSSTELADALPHILDRLAHVHRGHGITPVRLSEHWGDGLSARWALTMDTGIVPGQLGAWVRDLVDRDATLRRSWTHGDLVASNVVRRKKGGLVLVDWEHSREAPIMNDGAKLHLFAAKPQEAMGLVLEAFGTGEDMSQTPAAYSPAEELALCHAQLISQYPRRRAALQGHRRAEVYERQVRRQVERLQEVRAIA